MYSVSRHSWHAPVIPDLKRQKQEDQAILGNVHNENHHSILPIVYEKHVLYFQLLLHVYNVFYILFYMCII